MVAYSDSEMKSVCIPSVAYEKKDPGSVRHIVVECNNYAA